MIHYCQLKPSLQPCAERPGLPGESSICVFFRAHMVSLVRPIASDRYILAHSDSCAGVECWSDRVQEWTTPDKNSRIHTCVRSWLKIENRQWSDATHPSVLPNDPGFDSVDARDRLHCRRCPRDQFECKRSIHSSSKRFQNCFEFVKMI